MWKKLILMLILLSSLASAATLHGTVYDFSLDVIEDAMVEIDTMPKQTMVAKDGTYSFEVLPGEYTIRAETKKNGEIFSNVEERVSIVKEGSFVLDLILIESLEEETQLLEEGDEIAVDIEGLEEEIHPLWWLLVVVVLIVGIVIGFLGFKFVKARKYTKLVEAVDEIEEQFDEELEKLVDIIKKEGGRITQKDVRKRLGLSEAKVSLMITELEHKDVLKKIKKGRGNILILK